VSPLEQTPEEPRPAERPSRSTGADAAVTGSAGISNPLVAPQSDGPSKSVATVEQALGPAEELASSSASSGHGVRAAGLAPVPHPVPVPAEHVVRQLAEVVRNPGADIVEIALDPEELGRVRLVMQQGDLGLTVQITAERSETLDLMRRHAADLARDLRDLGHASVSFTFQDQGKGERREGRPDRSGWKEFSEPGGSVPAPAIWSTRSRDGIDIRL